MLFSLFSLLVLAPLPSLTFQLHHRILHPSSPDPPFFHRASILPDAAGNPRIESVPTLQTDFAKFETPRATDALYQLALDPQGDSPWIIPSVKAVRPLPWMSSPFHFSSPVPPRRHR